jgi:endonuclease YncB( thermonuclease family)
LSAILVLMLGIAVPRAGSASSADIVGAAKVLDDASLRIKSKIIRLYGIYIPSTGKNCTFLLRPPRCANRAALALEIKIQGFVRCRAIGLNADGTLNATCVVRRRFNSGGEDLAAYLLAKGLALALPEAPFEYIALERIAQTRRLGIWGFQVDSITSR